MVVSCLARGWILILLGRPGFPHPYPLSQCAGEGSSGRCYPQDPSPAPEGSPWRRGLGSRPEEVGDEGGPRLGTTGKPDNESRAELADLTSLVRRAYPTLLRVVPIAGFALAVWATAPAIAARLAGPAPKT